jgi:hypothetical protein
MKSKSKSLVYPLSILFPFSETEFKAESKATKRGSNGKILHSFSTSLDEITNLV